MKIWQAIGLVILAAILPGFALFAIFWWWIHKSFKKNHDMLFEPPPEPTEHEKLNGDVRPDMSSELEA